MGLTKVQKEGIETLINNNADNRVITGSSTANTLNGESGLTFDGTELKIGGDSNVSGTHGLEVYNTTGTVGTGLFAGTGGAEIKLQDTVSGETVKIAANGQASFYSQKADDNMVFYTRPSGGTDQARLLISGDGDVGIGTTAPDQKLHVHKGSAGSISSATNSVLTLENSTDVILQFLSPGSSANQIRFGDPADNGAGYINYNHNTNVLSFGTAGPEKMRIDSSGRLLVGTTNSSNGHIAASNLAVQGADLSIFKDSGGDNSGVSGHKLKLVTQSGSLGEVDVLSEGGGGPNGRGGAMRFYTKSNNVGAAAERMRIDSSGNVGIGATPSTRLHVAVNSSQTTRTSENTVLIKNTNNSASTCASLLLQSSNTDANIYRISTQKHGGGTGSEFHLDKGTSARMQMSGDHGDIKFGVDGTMINTFTPGLSNTTTGMGLEPRNGSIFLSRSNGAVLYCNTNTDGSQLATFRRNGNEQGKIIAHSSSVSYETTSDYRLKENAVAISDGITRLKQLKPYRFNFKSNSSETLDGFFAHEAQAIVPECASGTKDEVIVQAQVESGAYKESELGNPIYQGIDQSKLVPLLTAALQEEISKRESLETRVAALEAA